MRSRTTKRFRRVFQRLPKPVQRQARAAYRSFQQDPFHPSLRFKQVHPRRPIYSVRITQDYRAVGIREGKDVVWVWIGSHNDYERLLSQL